MSASHPGPWVAPENDYRGIADLPATGTPSLAVVIPVYQRADTLVRTLASFEAQSHRDFEVIVVDDGSTEDIVAAVNAADLDLPLRLLRRERAGFGAHRARNYGASETNAEVLLFVDADCIAHPDLIRQHLSWHSRAGNVVVAGTRTHLDGSAMQLDTIRTGTALENLSATGRAVMPQDWRRLFYRRNKQLTMGDAAFRAGLSSNLSMRRGAFEAVGGFSTVFREWGGEDTELTWRLWNAGMFVIPDNRALVMHQVQDDNLGAEGRTQARERALALVADLVPHRFYRKTPSPFHTTPKVSWIACAADRAETDDLWRRLSAATFPDTEIILFGPATAFEHLLAAADNSSRVSLVDIADGIGQAVATARGELVCLVDGRSRIDHRLLARAVGRLERDSRTGVARCSYRLDDNTQYRRLDDLLRLDLSLGRDGFPFFALVRRRELLKDPAALDDFTQTWPAILGRCRTEHLINDHAGLAIGTETAPRSVRPRDLFAAGGREVAKAGLRMARAARRRTTPPPAPATAPSTDERIRIDYIGFTGRNNLGDEAGLSGVRELLPGADIARDHADPEVLMVGGGTLINGKGYYLTRVIRNDSPNLEKVLFGTGVRNPDYWGTTEDMGEWAAFIESSIYAGVRGPDSVSNLRTLGYKGEMDILGDPALALMPPPGTEEVAGRVVVCPVHTGGNLWGGNDDAVFSALQMTIERLHRRGHEIVLMSAFPEDDRWLIQLMQAAHLADAVYVPGYEDLGETMRWLASAELVIGERLHASILAAACATPFVALEYRPKVRDFARSIGVEDLVVRTDELQNLDDAVAGALQGGDRLRTRLTTSVAEIRDHQHGVADRLSEDLAKLLR